MRFIYVVLAWENEKTNFPDCQTFTTKNAAISVAKMYRDKMLYARVTLRRYICNTEDSGWNIQGMNIPGIFIDF